MSPAMSSGRSLSKSICLPVALVVEERMPDVAHVDTYLVCASRLELALHHRHMVEVLDSVIVSHGMLALVAIGEHRHL